jgi:glycosyltransferase involved in cell wall biosynthesis
MSNVHYLGPVGRDDLPAYLQHSDVGIIPFDVANHRALIDGVNPIKLYEYLAAGLPVVASRWAEIEALGAPVALADTRSDWLAHLRNAVESGPPETGVAYAQAADWQRIVAKLIAHLPFAAAGDFSDPKR